ncbi:MAG: ABC transporter permease [Oscillospiraceae bacterium]|jgi:lipopolysaccharide transport system permease protein|nr:ABC transporter permease [Oscillospiraceae bacterium]
MASQNHSQEIVIEANGKNLQYWRDLWNYRSLVFYFAKRDFIVRYKQTLIGVAWSIIQPLISTFLMAFIFGSLAGFASGTNIPYRIVVYAGVLPWNLFARCVSMCSGTFGSSLELTKKTYFPRLIVPMANMLTALFDAAISYVILFLLMGVYLYMPPTRFALSFLFLLPIALLGMFAGIILSSFSIRWRDLHFIVPFLLQVGQYATPVAYSLSDLQKSIGGTDFFFNIMYYINPLMGFQSAFRWTVLDDQSFDLRSLLIGFCWLGLIVWVGIWRFRKVERTFVDIV